MKQLFEAFNSMEPRKVKIYSLGALATVLLILIFAFWLPVYESNLKAMNRLAQQKELLQWISKAKLEINALRKTQTTTTSTPKTVNSLFGFIEKSIEQKQLASYVKEFKQENPKKVSLQFDNVPFANIVSWLAFINKYNVDIVNAKIFETNTIGIVNSTFIIILK